MPSLKDVQNKIASVKKTKQITKAMNMVASAKLRKAQMKIERFRPYAEKYYELMGDMAAGVETGAHPLLAKRDQINTVGIMLITSDRGLCGAFNTNLINKAMYVAAAKKALGQKVVFYAVGKKAVNAARKSEHEMFKSYRDCMDGFDFSLASELGNEVIRAYLDEEVDEIRLVFGRFINVGKQEPSDLKMLPVSQDEHEVQAEGGSAQYMYEPSVEGILSELLPRFIKVQVYRGLLETSASEHAARMSAMDNASNNCDDMITNLTLAYNKARQAAITAELLDIVGGAEALKG